MDGLDSKGRNTLMERMHYGLRRKRKRAKILEKRKNVCVIQNTSQNYFGELYGMATICVIFPCNKMPKVEIAILLCSSRSQLRFSHHIILSVHDPRSQTKN